MITIQGRYWKQRNQNNGLNLKDTKDYSDFDGASSLVEKKNTSSRIMAHLSLHGTESRTAHHSYYEVNHRSLYDNKEEIVSKGVQVQANKMSP